MKKRVITVLIISLISILTLSSTAFAWTHSLYEPYPSYIAVHKDDTKDWCEDKGFSKYSAKIIAFYCDNVDILFKDDYRWHLNRQNFTGEDEDTRILQTRNEMTIAKRKIDKISDLKNKFHNTSSRWKKYKYKIKIKKAKAEALMYFGRSLHPIQDLYAHMDAGINTPDEEIGNSHGMLDEPPVEVLITYENGDTETRTMKIETMDSTDTFNYSFYDDINYDYVDGQWIFTEKCNKEDNSRWVKTKEATYELLDEFIEYAENKDINIY